jgi:hypothetical protein
MAVKTIAVFEIIVPLYHFVNNDDKRFIKQMQR